MEPNPLMSIGGSELATDPLEPVAHHTHNGIDSPPVDSVSRLSIEDEGSLVSNGASSINFIGSNVAVTAEGHDVTVTLTSDTVGEIFIPAEAMNSTTTAPCSELTKVEAGTNDVDYWVLDFDTTTAESCFFTIRMPDNWNASTVTAQFIWTNAAGLTTETVVWGIKGRAYADSDAIDQAYGSEITVTDTWLAQGDIHLSPESSAVTPAGTLAAGQWAQFKITRKTASDNMTGDARLLGVRLKYTRV